MNEVLDFLHRVVTGYPGLDVSDDVLAEVAEDAPLVRLGLCGDSY